ncbi:hypothetical protein EMPS_09614 [Entomortierella parvispora]|uniref:DNA topoisomerase (ATP-hydrolyzing) n=1 Tax=Entomortierella parvispora TaxID=205924 RepID=A0A9P3HIL5_9FUNG|nr:hypothetical protein EMPS_09614 [Entomortierella parvispora]
MPAFSTDNEVPPLQSDEFSLEFDLDGGQIIKPATDPLTPICHGPSSSGFQILPDFPSEMLFDDDFYTDGQKSQYSGISSTIVEDDLVSNQEDVDDHECIHSFGEWDMRLPSTTDDFDSFSWSDVDRPDQMPALPWSFSTSTFPSSFSTSTFPSSELAEICSSPEYPPSPFPSLLSSENFDQGTFCSGPARLQVDRPIPPHPASQNGDHVDFMETRLQPREWVLEQLEMMVAEILFDLSYQFPPKVVTQSRTKSEAILYDKQSGVIRRKRSSADECQGSLEYRTGIQMLHSDKVLTKTACTISTKRDVFYQDVQLFRSQHVVDRIVEDLACTLQVSRSCLNVVAGGRSAVYGSIRISTKAKRICPGDIIAPSIESNDPSWLQEDIRQIQFSNQTSPLEASTYMSGVDNDPEKNTLSKTDFNTLVMIPVNMDDILEVEIHPGTHFVLVVEKEATMHNLISSGFCESNGPCILLTSKGYPDQAARRLLRLISDMINARVWTSLEVPTSAIVSRPPRLLDSSATIPLLALVDCDPHGIEIYLTYRCGSIQSAYDNANLAIPTMQCIGQIASDWGEVLGGSSENDIISSNIQEQFRRSLIPLTRKDRTKLVKLLTEHPLVKNHDRWKSEISRMLHLNRKSEIQSLCLVDNRQQSQLASVPPLIQYLNRKLLSRHEWL